MQKLSFQGLLGRYFISHTNIQQVILETDSVQIIPRSVHSDFITNDVLLIENIEGSSINLDINPSLPVAVVSETKEIFKDYYLDAIRPEQPCTDFKMHITLNKIEPFIYWARQLSFGEKQSVEEIINDLLSKYIIRESNSPYCSPIVLTKKKTGEYRICVDFRTFK